MTPPRRIGQKTEYPLHAPPQRHHDDPAASRDQIRDLPNHPSDKASTDAIAGGAMQQADDHHAAVTKAITDQQTQQVPHLTTPSPSPRGST